MTFGGVIPYDFNDRSTALDAAHDGLKRMCALGINKLARKPGTCLRPLEAVESPAFLLPRLHVFAVCLPEVGIQPFLAGVQQIGVVQHLVIGVVLGINAQRMRLDAQVDVLRYQHHLTVWVAFAEVERDAEQDVVRVAGAHPVRQVRVHRLQVEIQPPGFDVGRDRRQLYPAGDVAIGFFHELVKQTAGLAHVARDFGHADLGVVQLLEDHDRDIHVVFLKAKNGGGVVDEDVGVEHEDLAFVSHRCDSVALRVCRVRRVSAVRVRRPSRHGTPDATCRFRRTQTYCVRCRDIYAHRAIFPG